MNMTIEKLNKIKAENQELVMVRKLVAEQGLEMAKHQKYRKQPKLYPYQPYLQCRSLQDNQRH